MAEYIGMGGLASAGTGTGAGKYVWKADSYPPVVNEAGFYAGARQGESLLMEKSGTQEFPLERKTELLHRELQRFWSRRSIRWRIFWMDL